MFFFTYLLQGQGGVQGAGGWGVRNTPPPPTLPAQSPAPPPPPTHTGGFLAPKGENNVCIQANMRMAVVWKSSMSEYTYVQTSISEILKSFSFLNFFRTPRRVWISAVNLFLQGGLLKPAMYSQSSIQFYSPEFFF